MRVFFPFFGQKSTKCAQKAVKCLIMFNYVTFLMFSKKNQFSPFPVKLSILVKSKMAAKMAVAFDEVTSPQRRHPKIYTSRCRAHHWLSTKGRNFSKYCNITKTQGGGGDGSINPPSPPLLYHGWVMSLLVRPRVNSSYCNKHNECEHS